ncbi:MAG: M48 family metallopeptidase [Rhodospirillaceae bacterium]|nr:M48 family metallopeptidase [Rhodospirillaceae bacterium]
MNAKTHTIEISGREVELKIRRHPRARHLILRIDDSGEGAVITMPMRATLRDALKMAKDKSSWILEGLLSHPGRNAFKDGMAIPFRGAEYVIRNQPSAIGVELSNGEIVIGGKPEHLPRRMRDWLIKNAKAEINYLVAEKTKLIDKKAGRITLRDTRTRWGSCGPTGNLNFSWRLIMAPAHVLDYLVAHEVAHLAHHDHGNDFWQLAEKLATDMPGAHDWLDKNGKTLHSYG